MTNVLGAPWHFWVVAIGTLALMFAWNRRTTNKQQQERMMEQPEEPKEVRLFGGPLNGKVEEVDERLDYFIVPYMPEDPDEKQQIGVIGDKILYAPSFAFYQQVGEPEFYFHRRDLTAEEFQAFNREGVLPEDLS